MLTAEEIAKLNEMTPKGEGCSCTYYQLDDNRGLKTYRIGDRHNIIAQHRLQKVAADHGCAPMVHSDIFDISIKDIPKLAFITENVEVLYNMFRQWCEVTHKPYDGWCDQCYWDTAKCLKGLNWKDDFAAVFSMLDLLDIETSDMNPMNCGYRQNGEPVVIDFDHCWER